MYVNDNEEVAVAPAAIRPQLAEETADMDSDSEDEAWYYRTKTQTASQESQPISESILSPQTPLESELARFTSKSNESQEIPHDVDVLSWWRDHEKVYPLLAKGDKKYVAIQASSCASERTFSIGANTVTAKRTKLDPQNVHMLVFCHENLKRMEFKLGSAILESEKEREEEEKCQNV
jgi:hypothetical protein